ncbi:Nn.00g075360.m01.CDS01 [Neocucurbitaria sp. VM-36]
MSDDLETPARPRTSRFKEHTNTNSSIRPPPDELWKDLGIEQLIEQFNEENQRPPVRRDFSGTSATSVSTNGAAAPIPLRASSEARAPGIYETSSLANATPVFGVPSVATTGGSTSATPVAPASSEGTFGRFQRAFASVFGNVLGKRKAGSVDAEKDKEKKVLDERKRAADAAYQEAKELGLLPTPKVFVRPAMAAKSHKCGRLVPRREDDDGVRNARLTVPVADTATPVRTPRTPTLYRTPSKKDLHKQKKLLRRVSDLEFKLASARKELQTVLNNETLPPVPPLPTLLPPTPNTSQSQSDNDAPLHDIPTTPEPQSTGKITKKRKATTDEDGEYKPVPTDSDGDISMSAASASEPERTIKRVKSSASRKNLKRQTTRLQKRMSKSNVNKEEIPVIVVPDGVSVPPIPKLPKGMEKEGKTAAVKRRDDGYGGLEHEMF